MIKIETGKNNDILREKSTEIKKYEFPKYIKIGKEMLKYIKNEKNMGVGLAAPQIGINKKMIVVSLLKTYDDESFSTLIMINPEIIEFSKELKSEDEGCLSLPGVNGLVERPDQIKLAFKDEKFKDKTLILKGLASRIVQHEIDHLNGILFVDRQKK